MNPNPSVSPDATPAQALWVQLATRITTQPLHYRSGEEETAAESIHSLFQKVRELLEKHPEAAQFRQIAVSLLNDTLRPYTARWHGWMTEDKERKDKDGKPVLRFRDEQVRRLFRKELKELQPELTTVRNKLAELAGITEPLVDSKDRIAGLGDSLAAGIRQQVEIKADKESPARLVTPAEINAAEHQIILSRRITLGHLHVEDSPRTAEEVKPNSGGKEGQPDSKPEYRLTDAIGLALSGGGIRSATFCLGIAQVLAKKRLLMPFDYLSTVSGGGYFGSFLSCALGTKHPGDADPSTKSSAEEKIKDVFLRQEEGSRQKGIESGLVRHLRNNSKYLLHGGFLGKMRIVGLLLSGLLWNLMIMLPIPLGAALLAKAFGGWLWDGAIQANGPALPPIPDSFAGWALLWLAAALAITWLALPVIQLLTHGKPPKSGGALFRSVWENLTLVLGLVAALAGVVYLLPALFHGYEWLRAGLASRTLAKLGRPGFADLLPASLTGVASAALAVVSAWLAPKWPRLRALAVKLFILTGPLLLLFVFLLVANRMGLARGGGEQWGPGWILWVTLGLVVWGSLCVNINTLAPHRFYRNRLCECYLARRIWEKEGRKQRMVRTLSREKAQGNTEVLKQVKLTDLCADLAAPYHLLNMTVNAPTSDNKDLRGRGGDFFLASRHLYGSPLTGYAKTGELERTDPHFDLGTAMAVSGAAASTSMGWQTLPHFRFLMTLFNVRLGYWLQNPGKPPCHWLLSGAGPWYLFREMLGRMDENCRYVNLSDGGHIENLAVYELLRRRCKFILCVDGGCDPGMRCGDLIRLQRYAEIDLGIRMHFDTSDLQIGSNGLSRAHAILVKIDYEPDPATREGSARISDQLGWMLYVKLAMTGVEPTYVKDYKRENPDFPHQSTGDQIYDEAQFEAYRALGECAMEGMFREEIVGQRPPESVRDWFQCLANNLLPDNDPVFAQKAK